MFRIFEEKVYNLYKKMYKIPVKQRIELKF